MASLDVQADQNHADTRQLQVRDLVRIKTPEQDSMLPRAPSDIGEIRQISAVGRYLVKLLGHPVTEAMREYARQDLEVRWATLPLQCTCFCLPA